LKLLPKDDNHRANMVVKSKWQRLFAKLNQKRYDSYNCLKDNTDCNYIVSSLLAKMIRFTRRFSYIACKGKWNLR